MVVHWLDSNQKIDTSPVSPADKVFFDKTLNSTLLMMYLLVRERVMRLHHIRKTWDVQDIHMQMALMCKLIL